MLESCVYWLHLPEHTDIFSEGYVGVSKRPTQRFKEHSKIKNNKSHENLHLENAFKKYGNSIILDILLKGEEQYCYDIEKICRPVSNIGWNINKGGIHPPKQFGPKLYVSIALTGKPSNFFGKKHKEESKIKIRQKLLGEKNPMYGKSHTIEARSKISKARSECIGQKWYYNPIDKKTGRFFPGKEPLNWLMGRK